MAIFFQEIVTPDVLYEDVIEVSCRVTPVCAQRCKLPESFWRRKVTGRTKEDLHVLSELDVDDVKKKLLKVKENGIKSIAVVLMHSFT